jgi:FkbM family methyltransferase
MADSNFYYKLTKELLDNLLNNYSDNFDYYRYGPEPKSKFKLKRFISEQIEKFGFYRVEKYFDNLKSRLDGNDSLITTFEFLYNLLENEPSKNLLIKVLVYRILDHRKVKLPLNTHEYWQSIKLNEKLCKSTNERIKTDFLNWSLYKHDFGYLGFPIKIFTPIGNILFNYRVYCLEEPEIKVSENDFVIDAGACWGETALYFAYLAGPEGKVFSFEFIKENIEIFDKNLDLNPDLKSRIELIKHPVFDKSNIELSFASNGPGSAISKNEDEESVKEITVSIDDLVKRMIIPKVDFIKMDIEGSELKALKGAEKTLKTFKPKLAICLYHNIDDFRTIPEYIHSLNIGYKFYFGHFSIHSEESVLFAKTDQ